MNADKENNGATITHRHSRCMTTNKTKITKGPPQTQTDQDDELSEDEPPLTPRAVNAGDKTLFPELRRGKAVMFKTVQQRKIFRYPPPPELFVPVKRPAWDDSDDSDSGDDDMNGTQERTAKLDKKQKVGAEPSSESQNNEDEQQQWWWDGWEEEKPFSEPEARGGRPQVRRRSRWFSEESSDDED